jgi:hypothetical protein
MFDIQIIGIKFVKPNQFGDFNWMCKQEEYANSLFIFNDNIEYHNTNRAGAGNAIMRKYNAHSTLSTPLSAGIPTGSLSTGGFEHFNKNVKRIIDDSINEIIELIKYFNYTHIYYSAELTGELGTSIFEVNKKVIHYITHKIFGLSHNKIHVIKQVEYSNDYFSECDFEFDE